MASTPAARPAAVVDPPFTARHDAGIEWVVDAFGCAPESARSIEALGAVIDRVVCDLALHPMAPPIWQTFDGGGITGLVLLSESHVTCHSFPETGFVAFNLYCCRPRTQWSWEAHLGELLGATRVVVRELIRG